MLGLVTVAGAERDVVTVLDVEEGDDGLALLHAAARSTTATATATLALALALRARNDRETFIGSPQLEHAIQAVPAGSRQYASRFRILSTVVVNLLIELS